jgi:hypothetical protein
VVGLRAASAQARSALSSGSTGSETAHCRRAASGRQSPGARSENTALLAGAPAPGQAAVCYNGERVLGGGWISRRDDAAESAAA